MRFLQYIMFYIFICCSSLAYAEGLPANPWPQKASSGGAAPMVAEHQSYTALNSLNQPPPTTDADSLKMPDISSVWDKEAAEDTINSAVDSLQDYAAQRQQQAVQQQKDAYQAELKDKLSQAMENLQQSWEQSRQSQTDNTFQTKQNNNSQQQPDWKNRAKAKKAMRDYNRYKNKAVAEYNHLKRSTDRLGRKVRGTVKTFEQDTEKAINSLKK